MALDDLPEELVVHILQFLPGEDVSRFKGLGRFYKEIVAKNKRSLPRPIISFSIYFYGPVNCVKILIQHNYRMWKYTTPLIRPETEVEEEKEEKPTNTSGKLRNFCRLSISKLKRRNRMKNSSSCSQPFPKEKEYAVGYRNFFSTFTNNSPSDLNLQEILEFILEKGDIDRVEMASLREVGCIPEFIEAIKRTNGRILGIYFNSTNINYDLLMTIGNQKYAKKNYPHMNIQFTKENANEEELFWPQAGLLNASASKFSQIAVSFKDIDVAIVKIAEMWTDNGCPNILFRPELDVYDTTPWFFAEWDIKKYSLYHKGLEVSVEKKKQILFFKDKSKGKILRIHKVFTTNQGFHTKKDYFYFSVAFNVCNEY